MSAGASPPAAVGASPAARVGASRAVAAGVPLAAAVAELRRLLAVRQRACGRPAPPPAVVALGATNLLHGADPERMGATVHLSAREVLVGPWGAGAQAGNSPTGGPWRGGAQGGSHDGGAQAWPCGHCVGVRWQRLRGRSERDALETGDPVRAAGDWPPVTDFLADAVWHLLHASGRWDGPGAGNADGLAMVTSVDLATLATARYPLLADPLCPSCRPEPQPWQPPLLGSRPRPARRYRTTAPGGYRLPEAALVNPACGALAAGTVINIASPTTAPVSGSGFVRSYAGLIDMSWSGQSTGFARSRRLAMLEGLERYAGTHPRQPHPPVLDSLTALGDTALDPTTCGMYAPETYRDDPQVTPFDPDRKIPWVWGWSLRDSRPLLVPRRLCYYSTGALGDNFVFTTSNGCALGSCLEEAALFGLLELVERDAFLLAWYGGARLTEIDLDSCGGGRLPALVERARLHGYDVHAFDNRIDMSVPVVTGLAVRRDDGPGSLSFAAGASLDPATAVESALAEVLTYIPQMHRQTVRRLPELTAMADDYQLVRQLVDHSGLFGLPRMRQHATRYLDPGPKAAMADLYPSDPDADRPGDLWTDLGRCVAELADAGHDVIVVEQTTPEQRRLGLACACVVVPGLIPIDFGWRRQRAMHLPRLRTAFRRAGWRPTDLTDAEVHRVPHPFP